MPPNEPTMSQELEDAEAGYGRVKLEVEAQDPNDLSALNTDLVNACSIALGVAPTIMEYRDRAANLSEFNIKNFDKLNDYAKATWYLHITNLPAAEAAELSDLETEMVALRGKLMLWAGPLVASGKLPDKAIQAIKDGVGAKAFASDVVSLVALYRANWDHIHSMCGVTVEDLDRGAKIAPAVFAGVSLRDNQPSQVQGDAALRVHQAWTLLDRAYSQCRRAIAFLRWDEGDVDRIAPSLRRNTGGRAKPTHQPDPQPEPVAPAPAVPAAPRQAPIGGSSSPFVPNN